MIFCSKHVRFYNADMLSDAKLVSVEPTVIILNNEPMKRNKVFVDGNPNILMITGKASPKLGIESGKGGQLRVTVPAGSVIKELAKRAGVSYYGKSTVTAFAIDKRNSKGEAVIIFRIDGKATALTIQEIKCLQGTFRLVLEGGYVTTKKNEPMWSLKVVEGLYLPEVIEQESDLLFFDEYYESL